MTANSEATSPAERAIAETTERRVFALVAVILAIELFNNKLHLIVWQRWIEEFYVVLDDFIFPRRRRLLFKINADIKNAVLRVPSGNP